MAVLTQLQLEGSSTVYDVNDARISATSVATATHFLATNSGVSAINPISAADLASVLGDCGWSSVKIASQETKAVYSDNAIIETCYWGNRYKKGRFTPANNSFVIMEELPADDNNITLSVTDGTLCAKNNTAYEISLNYKVTRRG